MRPRSHPVRVLRPETAITMRSMMEGVVIKPYGTGHKYARLLGYTSAGKTGTAQIYDYRDASVHALLQRVVHGIRAGDESAHRDRGHD